MNFTLSLNEIFYIVTALLSLGVGYAYLKYTTTENAEKAKKQDERLFRLENRCNEMIEEDKAFKTFVTLDIYHQRNEHLTETMADIKNQNNTIINLLTKAR
jgi:hypothetical protein